MKERATLFTPEMARATLRKVDPKTQTRRVVRWPKPTKHLRFNTDLAHIGGVSKNLGYLWIPYRHVTETDLPWEDCGKQRFFSPYGDPAWKIGNESGPADRLRMLTTWAVRDEFDHLKPTCVNFGATRFWHAGLSECKPKWAGRLRPGRFLPLAQRSLMPLLEVKAIRAERIQSITEDDARAEGILESNQGPLMHRFGLPSWDADLWRESARAAFFHLFYGIRRRADILSDKNPWVWVVTFKLLAESGEVAA